MRTIIEIPEDDVRLLDIIARKTKRSRADIIRGCIRNYLDMAGEMQTIAHDIFGNYQDVLKENSVDIQNALRAGWNEEDKFAKILHDHKHGLLQDEKREDS